MKVFAKIKVGPQISGLSLCMVVFYSIGIHWKQYDFIKSQPFENSPHIIPLQNKLTG